MIDPQPITPTPVAAYSPGTISRTAALQRRLAPTGNMGDAIFRVLLGASAVLLLVVVVMLITVMWWNSRLSIAEFGLGFLTSREWNPGREIYGALPYVYGTLASSLLALLISVPLSLGVAVFLTEQAPRRIARPVTFLVELLAAIPSVVYGLWGINDGQSFAQPLYYSPLPQEMVKRATAKINSITHNGKILRAETTNVQ